MAAEASDGARRYAVDDEFIARDVDEVPPFCNSFWGNGDAGYEVISTRMKTANRTLEEVRALYKERADIEAEYAKRLGKLAKSIVGREETGSTRQALEVVRGELDMTSRVHSDLSAMIRKDLEGGIAEFQTKSQNSRKNATASIDKLFKNKQAQESYVNKSRERYEQDCIKINGYTAQSSLVQGRDLDKVTSKLDKAQSTVQANEKDYQNFVRALKDTTLRWNTEWKTYLDQCQDMEEERLDFIKSNLWNYANAISAVCVADDEGCERVRVALENCDTPKDIAVFVQQKGTGALIPDAPEYINYARGQHAPNRSPGHMANFVRETARPSQPPPPPPSQPHFGSGEGSPGTGMSNGASYQSPHDDVPASEIPPPPPQAHYKPIVPPSGGVGLPGMVLSEQTGPAHHQLSQHQKPIATPPKPERRMSAKNFIAKTPGNRASVAGPLTDNSLSHNSNIAQASGSQQASIADNVEEDPIAKALASLRMRPGGTSPAPSHQQLPPPSTGGPSSSVVSSNRRYSQQPPERALSPGPSLNGSSHVPSSPSAAFMQAPQQGHSPIPVEDVVSSYGQSFPGERKSLSRQGSISSAISSSRVNPSSSQAPVRGRSPAPSEGFAGVGARGRSPSPQPYQGNFQQQSTPSQDGRTHRHQAGQSSISAPQHAPNRTGTPLGISLDASGSVTHDQMAHEYMQRAGSVPPPQQQRPQSSNTAAYQQPPPPQQYQQYPAQQLGRGEEYGPPPAQQRPSSVVHGHSQQPSAYANAPHSTLSNTTVSYTAPPAHYHQGQSQQVQYSYQQPQQAAGPPQKPYNQIAPSFHHQDSSSSVGYSTSKYGQQHQQAPPGGEPSYGYGGPPGRGTTPAPSAAAPPETAASAYMHQYQRQSSLASSVSPAQHEPTLSQPQQRWSQQGGAGPPAGSGGAPSGYAPQQQQVPPPAQQQPHQQSVSAAPPSQAPTASQQSTAIAPTGQYSDSGKPILFYVKAMYDYTATTEEEFSFTLGDIIAVTQTDPDGWWQGELLDEARRKRGANTFPSNFTNLLT